MKCILRFFRKNKLPLTEDTAVVKYLIVGLGNIGHEYEGTRHNIGFDVVDELAGENQCSWRSEQYGAVTDFKFKGRNIYLLKPNTYMNLSGKAVRYWVQKLKIPSQNWLVVVDEIQFEIGVVKLHKKGSPGGHNGLKSVQDIMQTSQYARIRLGIGNDFHPGQQVEYVLGKWRGQEWDTMKKAIVKAGEIVKSFATIGIDRAMSSHNSK